MSSPKAFVWTEIKLQSHLTQDWMSIKPFSAAGNEVEIFHIIEKKKSFKKLRSVCCDSASLFSRQAWVNWPCLCIRGNTEMWLNISDSFGLFTHGGAGEWEAVVVVSSIMKNNAWNVRKWSDNRTVRPAVWLTVENEGAVIGWLSWRSSRRSTCWLTEFFWATGENLESILMGFSDGSSPWVVCLSVCVWMANSLAVHSLFIQCV